MVDIGSGNGTVENIDQGDPRRIASLHLEKVPIKLTSSPVKKTNYRTGFKSFVHFLVRWNETFSFKLRENPGESLSQ